MSALFSFSTGHTSDIWQKGYSIHKLISMMKHTMVKQDLIPDLRGGGIQHAPWKDNP